MRSVRRILSRIMRYLELGHARMTYTNLYVSGAIDVMEYLVRMKELDE